MNKETMWVLIIFALFLTVAVTTYLVTKENQKLAEAGLQQCVVKMNSGDFSELAWQKECQTITVNFSK